MRKREAGFEVFLQLEVRAGRVVAAEPLVGAHKPALKLEVNFGGEVGILRSTAQLTRRYVAEELVGTQVLAIVNFPPKRVAGVASECLVLAVVNPEDPGDVVLVRPDAAGTVGWELA